MKEFLLGYNNNQADSHSWLPDWILVLSLNFWPQNIQQKENLNGSHVTMPCMCVLLCLLDPDMVIAWSFPPLSLYTVFTVPPITYTFLLYYRTLWKTTQKAINPGSTQEFPKGGQWDQIDCKILVITVKKVLPCQSNCLHPGGVRKQKVLGLWEMCSWWDITGVHEDVSPQKV